MRYYENFFYLNVTELVLMWVDGICNWVGHIMGVRDEGWHTFILYIYIKLTFNDFHLHVWYLLYLVYHLSTDFAQQCLSNKWWIKSVTVTVTMFTVTILSVVAELNLWKTPNPWFLPAWTPSLNYTIKSSTSIKSPSPLLTQGATLTMAQGNYKNKYGTYIC